MDIKQYRELIRSLALRRSGEPVFNGSADHAAVIAEYIFASAQSTVRILTGELNAKVYGNSRVVQRAKEFLGHSDHKLQVMIESDTLSPSHPLVGEIAGNENVEFYLIPEDLSNQFSYHFMTGDNDCYRFEEIKNSHKAVAAFGQKDTVENLNGIFDIIKRGSVPLGVAELHAR